MKTKLWTTRFLLVFFLLWSISASAADKTKPASNKVNVGTTIQVKTDKGIISVKLPLTSPKYADLRVAEINGDPISLAELNRELLSIESSNAGHQNLKKILARLVNTRLMVEEAHNIGFDETDDFKNAENEFKQKLLRMLVRRQEVPQVPVSEEKVKKLYDQMRVSVKVESIAFKKKEDAEKAYKEIKAGATYDNTMKKYLLAKKAQGSLLGARVYSFDQLAPKIITYVKGAKAGDISKPLFMEKGVYALVKVAHAVETVDDPKIKMKARSKLQTKANVKALRAYLDKLKKKYAVIHQKIIDGINYEAKKPGLKALKEDKRVAIEIKGEPPITVGDLTNSIDIALYHGGGVKGGMEAMNNRKKITEDNLLYKKLFAKRAKVLELEKSKAYQKNVEAYEKMALFNTFVNKIIVPESKVKDKTARKYYDEHIADYSTPKMLRIKSLIFDNAESAQHAMDMLEKGTDMNWMSANAEHQEKKDTKGLLQFDGKVLTEPDLPKGVQDALVNVKNGDFRMYNDTKNHFYYVLLIEKVYPPKPQPYSEVRMDIGKMLFRKNITKGIEEWAKKLRKHYEIKTYLVETNNTK